MATYLLGYYPHHFGLLKGQDFLTLVSNHPPDEVGYCKNKAALALRVVCPESGGTYPIHATTRGTVYYRTDTHVLSVTKLRNPSPHQHEDVTP